MHLRSLKKTKKDVSLYDPIGTDKEGNEITLIDILGSEQGDVAERMLPKHVFCENVLVQLKIEKSKIYKNLDILDDREKEVVVGRFGLITGGEERTQREIAKGSYVPRIEKRALMKLYHEFYSRRSEFRATPRGSGFCVYFIIVAGEWCNYEQGVSCVVV
ncbi:RNA polymerase sporulation-specific sigma factor [Paenibacillus methanolicus]|uniref:RNA polymerase sporulation-specific sigma factor n=1 Tax=Paenibacillus methanolicus TaxID=582686 RepID=A0A5S5BVN0_9BACL|nr:RNA polymerase sporulation-specific sigma factor [Paenibacillus methanolicus]